MESKILNSPDAMKAIAVQNLNQLKSFMIPRSGQDFKVKSDFLELVFEPNEIFGKTDISQTLRTLGVPYQAQSPQGVPGGQGVRGEENFTILADAGVVFPGSVFLETAEKQKNFREGTRR